MGRLRVHGDERGATAVLVALLLPALLTLSAVAFGTLSMAGGERELQRAADAGALATASRLPLVDVTSAPGLGDLKPGLGQITGDVCTVVEDNVASAPMHRAFGSNVTCSTEHRPFGAQLSDALQAGLSVLPGNGGNLDPLLDSFNLPALLPGVATPYVEVTVGSDLDPPMRALVSPGEDVELQATAVARRRIKNAVLVPAVESSVICRVSGLLGSSDVPLGDLLGNLTLLNNVRECRTDPNQTLAIPREPALETLDEVADTVEDIPALSALAPLVRELRFDVADVYNPPTDGAVPTQHEVIEAAAADDEDVLVILANPVAGSGGLLQGLIGASAVPILDVVAVPASTLADCDLDSGEPCVTLEDAVGLSQGQGLFRASLVEPQEPAGTDQ